MTLVCGTRVTDNQSVTLSVKQNENKTTKNLVLNP